MSEQPKHEFVPEDGVEVPRSWLRKVAATARSEGAEIAAAFLDNMAGGFVVPGGEFKCVRCHSTDPHTKEACRP